VGDIDLVWKREYTRFENLAPKRHEQFDEFNYSEGEFR
jgi:hypothetical protein